MPLSHLSYQVVPSGVKGGRVAGGERLIDVGELIKLRVREDASKPTFGILRKVLRKSDDRREPVGEQRGGCHMEDGTRIDEWELFRRNNPRSSK